MIQIPNTSIYLDDGNKGTLTIIHGYSDIAQLLGCAGPNEQEMCDSFFCDSVTSYNCDSLCSIYYGLRELNEHSPFTTDVDSFFNKHFMGILRVANHLWKTHKNSYGKCYENRTRCSFSDDRFCDARLIDEDWYFDENEWPLGYDDEEWNENLKSIVLIGEHPVDFDGNNLVEKLPSRKVTLLSEIPFEETKDEPELEVEVIPDEPITVEVIGPTLKPFDDVPKEIENNVSRDSQEYIKWQKLVLKKYDYKCDICGDTHSVEAHHLFGFSEHPELAYEINNGVTMCKWCHKKFHSKEYYGVKGFGPVDYMNFRDKFRRC